MNNNVTKQAVIFDMDGVLVDTEPVYFGISRLLFDRLGIQVSLEENFIHL
jgi:beta-phosphoglucomutase-like phosphatase (HAD superfamily)